MPDSVLCDLQVHPAINTFSCRAIGSTQVMRDLPMIECWTRDHLGMIVWGGIVFVIWVVSQSEM